MPTEEWRPCRRFPRYEVSSEGRVRTTSGVIARPRHKTRRLPYLYRSFYIGNKVFKTAMIAPLIADAFLGPRPSGLQIHHIDNDCQNNRVENLQYCTQSENVRASYAAGRDRQHTYNAFSAGDYAVILSHWNSGLTQCQIARCYGIDNAAVSKIVNGRTTPRLKTERLVLTRIGQ